MVREGGSRAKRWFARLALMGLGVAVSVVVAELAFRALGMYLTHPRTYVGQYADAPASNFAPDPKLGWRMPKGARYTQKEKDGRDILYVADENGFRIDPDAPSDRRPQPSDRRLPPASESSSPDRPHPSPRSARSGDPGRLPPASELSGRERRIIAVGDSFTFGTGVAAADSYPAVLARRLGFALTNVAQPGYGLDQVWQSLLLEAIPRKPDLVVAGIYPEDLERSLSAYRNRMNKPTFRLEAGALVAMTAADRPGPITRFLEERSRLFTLSRQVLVNAGYRFGVGEMWNLNAAMLDDMMRACRDARIPIVFVHIPPNTLDEFAALGEHLRRAGALFVDVLPAMKAQSAPLYLERDMHLNEAGHALVASQVEALLRGQPEILGSRASSRTAGR